MYSHFSLSPAVIHTSSMSPLLLFTNLKEAGLSSFHGPSASSSSSASDKIQSNYLYLLAASVIFIQNHRGFRVWFHPQQCSPLFSTSLLTFGIFLLLLTDTLCGWWEGMLTRGWCWWFLSYRARGPTFTLMLRFLSSSMPCLYFL